MRALAMAAIDAGAALVLGHHAHVLQGWQRYGAGVIVWGLGNFVFDSTPRTLRPLDRGHFRP
jgi:poly-gamma-glutamate synthesis protein (capsule biosynthesis protein)